MGWPAGDIDNAVALLDNWVDRPERQGDMNKPAEFDDYAQGALLEAIFRNQPGKVKRLLKQGARANPVLYDDAGDPFYVEFVPDYPLHVAIEHECDESIIRALIAAGADLNAHDYCGRTPVLCAVGRYRNTNYLELLIESGADVDKPNSETGEAPLYRAAWASKKEDFALALLGAGANPTGRGFHGRTALHAAGGRGKVTVVAALLERGAAVDAVDENGDTPLHAAVTDGNVAVIRLLLDADADIHIRNKQGYSSLRLTLQYPQLRSLLKDAAKQRKNSLQAAVVAAAPALS